MKRFALLLAATAFALPAFAAPKKIDASKSYIRFVSKQMNVPVEGKFKTIDGTVDFDPKKPEATKAEFEVDLGSIDMGTPEGETEARRPLWFNVPQFPKGKFSVSSVKSTGPNKFEAAGALTIKGITKPVTLELELNGFGPDAYGGFRAGFSAKTEISRKAYGVDIDMPMDGGGVVVGDKINVELEIEAVLRTA